jgi:hypothetical protein
MFKNPFKRTPKAATTEPAEDIRNKRPRAGEIRAKGLNETLFLAPLPVYTGQVQIGRRSFSEMNDTYLELGGSNWGMVEQGKQLAAQIWIALFTAFIAPVLISVWLAIHSPPEINQSFFEIVGVLTEVFATGSILFVIPLGAYVYGILSGVWKDAKTYPVRFNRQRREVCYIDSATHRVLIVPWESVVAWVANSQGVSSYGATRDYTFGMGLEDEAQDRVQFILLPQPSDAHALGMWAAIRNYMEEGQLVDVKSPWIELLGMTLSEDELKPYEGLHTFEIEKHQKYLQGFLHRDDEHAKTIGLKKSRWPLRFWYIRRVFVFWKMPYLLAEWGHRKGRPTLPEQVVAWSQPLPPEQWAKPSAALQKANVLVKTAMDKKGMTFVQACKAAGLH